jgi:hypothetical protein
MVQEHPAKMILISDREHKRENSSGARKFEVECETVPNGHFVRKLIPEPLHAPAYMNNAGVIACGFPKYPWRMKAAASWYAQTRHYPQAMTPALYALTYFSLPPPRYTYLGAAAL